MAVLADPTSLRSSGVLAHVTSLPGGGLGGAVRFLDWLARAGQRWWQVLPLTPPDGFGSPYASPSAFASWPGLLADPEAPVGAAEIVRFRTANAYWADDWAQFHGGEHALADQVRFDREWSAVRAHAARRGIRILGDIPYYVAGGGADVAAHPHLFVRDAVAGVPPDDFSDDGQLWGNPPYDWSAMAAEGYRWWCERTRRVGALVDAARIDHFRGFAAWWAVPTDATTAREGAWRPGPGAAAIEAMRRAAPGLGLVAEDLGIITEDVVRLIEGLGLPGIRVLQYAFNDDPDNPHRLVNHPGRAMAVTGTHDNDTVCGWWSTAPDGARHNAGHQLEAAGIVEGHIHRALIRLALGSRAGLCVIPLQDVLGLGSEARMNTPGTATGNWAWRVEADALELEAAEWLAQATRAAGRGNDRTIGI